MAILPVVQTALRGLRAYPLRSALAPLGIHDIDMPASPERVWRAIQEARQ